MADFYQTGVITTLHKLGSQSLRSVESAVEDYSESFPIGLVLPALYSDFERPALWGIVSELARVRFLKQIVVCLGKATHEQYESAATFFREFSPSVKFLWTDGPNVQRLLRVLEERGLPAGPEGRGRSCWLGWGYLLAARQCETIVVHSADIANYDRQLLARLCCPIVDPDLSYDFAKGYFGRSTDRLYHRVTRLFLEPLIRAVRDMAPATPFLDFLSGVRYAVAGEFAMRSRLARVSRIPGNGTLEIGMLGEAYHHCSPTRICQVEIADESDTRPAGFRWEDPWPGMTRLAGELAQTFFQTLVREGVTISDALLKCVAVRYVRFAQDAVERHAADARFNQIEVDRQAEELAITVFAHGLRAAGACFYEDPLSLTLLPNWTTVRAAIPDFLEQLVEAEKEDRELSKKGCVI